MTLKGISETQFLSFQNDLRQHVAVAVSTADNGKDNASSSSTSIATTDVVDVNTAVLFSALYSLLLHVMVNRVKLSTLTQGKTDSQNLTYCYSLLLHVILICVKLSTLIQDLKATNTAIVPLHTISDI